MLLVPSFFNVSCNTPFFPADGEARDGVEFSLEMCAMEEGSESVEVYHGSETECTVGNLLPGTTYRFQVRAANNAGVGHSKLHACFIF